MVARNHPEPSFRGELERQFHLLVRDFCWGNATIGDLREFANANLTDLRWLTQQGINKNTNWIDAVTLALNPGLSLELLGFLDDYLPLLGKEQRESVLCQTTKAGFNIFLSAVLGGHVEVVDKIGALLVEHVEEPRLRNMLLHISVRECVRERMEGVVYQLVDAQNATHLACLSGNPEVADRLVHWFEVVFGAREAAEKLMEFMFQEDANGRLPGESGLIVVAVDCEIPDTRKQQKDNRMGLVVRDRLLELIGERLAPKEAWESRLGSGRTLPLPTL